MNQEQCVQSGVIEALTNQLAGSDNDPLLIVGNCGDLSAERLALFFAHPAFQYNNVLGKSLQPLCKIAIWRQRRGSALPRY